MRTPKKASQLISTSVFTLMFLCVFSTKSLSQSSAFYSSVDYNRNLQKQDKENNAEYKKLERHLYYHRKERIKDKALDLQLYFHNYTGSGTDAVREYIGNQFESLEATFAVDAKTYYQLYGEEIKTENNIPLIKLEWKGADLRPKRVEWSDWKEKERDIVDEEIEVNPQQEKDDGIVDIYIVERLPKEYGLGYSKFRWNSTKEGKDIVISAEAFGNRSGKYDKGMTLVHLIGNYLGLYPLTGRYPCGDDRVEDTPIHSHPVDYVLNEKLKIISPCDNQFYQVTNVMSHSPDRVKKGFTLGQWRRMFGIQQYLKNKKAL